MKTLRRFVPVFAGFAFAVMAAMWAVISPVGSSPDDDFHMASIWCAWGTSDSCLTETPIGSNLPWADFYVPRELDFQCFVETAPASAACALDQEAGWIPGRVNLVIGTYPPVFHAAMRVFVGPDIDTSVRAMRIANGILAGALLAFALTILKPRFKRAVALTWLIGIIPFGLWFIASTNPSSWSIIAGGLFWAFLANWLTSESLASRNAWLSFVGMVITVVLAAGSRSDAALALAVAALAVAIFASRTLRSHPKRLLLVLIPIPVLILGVLYRVRSLGGLGGIQIGTMGDDQSLVGLLAQWNRYAWEFPSLVSGMLGGEEPNFLQASTYIYGLANQDVLLPSTVLVLTLILLGGVVFWGLTSYSGPKLLSLGFILASMVMLPLVTLSRFNFANMYQPRYLLPLFLAFIGIAATVRLSDAPGLRRLQAYGIAVGVLIVGATSLLATTRRFTNGQQETWLSLGFTPEWWWSDLGHPLGFVLAGTVATAVYAGALAWIARNPATASRRLVH